MHRTTSIAPPGRRALTLATAAVLLGACLGAAAGPAAGAAPKVRMAYLQSDIHHLALWVALERDLFRANGVEVEIAGVFRAGPEIMTAFAAGDLDMAYVGEAPSTTAVANKAARVVAIAQVNTEGSALVVAKQAAGIRSLEDLKGRTVAVPGHSTVQDFLLRRALAARSIALQDVNIIVVKPPEMINALRTGQIDAFIAWEPFPSKAGTEGVGRKLATSAELWPEHPCCVLVADAAFRGASPEQVRAVVRAHVQATEFIAKNPEEAVRIGAKYTGMDEATVREAMRTVQYTPTLSVAGEREYVKFLTELGYIKLDDPDGFVERFLDPSVLRDIQP